MIERANFNPPRADVFGMPQLGGNHYDRQRRFREVASLFMSAPLVPTQVLRDISARACSVVATYVELRELARPVCDRSFGCPSLGRSRARATLADNPRPTHPSNHHPIIRAFPPIPEDTLLWPRPRSRECLRRARLRGFTAPCSPLAGSFFRDDGLPPPHG